VLLILPIAPLLAWKRGDLKLALRRLMVAAAIAIVGAALVFIAISPRKALAAGGAGLALWLIAGSLTELAERIRLGRTSAHESLRRLGALPRASLGMTLAHIGVGVFIFGAACETAFRVETAGVLAIGQSLPLGTYSLRLDSTGEAEGPNYLAERGAITVTRAGQTICDAKPERRLYAPGRQTTSKVALCLRDLGDVYVVLGEQRPTAGGRPGWLVRAYVNPLARLIFFGPLLMALGGALSLSDRRLRLGVPRRAADLQPATEAAP
jgi:cytochrome c-type biogenesis protein CcmF